MSKFKDEVIKMIGAIPHGKVVSYGQIAAYLGTPRAARAVGMILNKLPPDTDVPWWRVVNNSGRITIKGSIFTPDDQAARLKAEGIAISNEYELDIEKHRFLGAYPERAYPVRPSP